VLAAQGKPRANHKRVFRIMNQQRPAPPAPHRPPQGLLAHDGKVVVKPGQHQIIVSGLLAPRL